MNIKENKFFIKRGTAALGYHNIPCDVKTGAIIGVFNQKFPHDISNELGLKLLQKAQSKPLYKLVNKGGKNVEEVVDYLLCTKSSRKLKSKILADAITAVRGLYRRNDIHQSALTNRIFTSVNEAGGLLGELERIVAPCSAEPSLKCDLRTAYVISMIQIDCGLSGRDLSESLRDISEVMNPLIGLFDNLTRQDVGDGVELILDTPKLQKYFTGRLVNNIYDELRYCVKNPEYYLRVAYEVFDSEKVRLKCKALANKYGIDLTYI